MIHTMWKCMDKYMVMYLKMGKKDDALEKGLTVMCEPLLHKMDPLELEFKEYSGFLGVKQ
jgi:hypothetical protein